MPRTLESLQSQLASWNIISVDILSGYLLLQTVGLQKSQNSLAMIRQEIRYHLTSRGLIVAFLLIILSHHNYVFSNNSYVTFVGELYQIGRWATYNGATESGISENRQNENRAFTYRVEKEDKSGLWRSCNTQVGNHEYHFRL